MQMLYTVAIVGRSNVGKTTIFNRLIGKKLAIVSDGFGITRDRNEVQFKYYDLDVNLIDSAGIEYQNAKKNTIEEQMFNQAVVSIDNADLCLFVVDCRSGISVKDNEVFNILRKKNKTVILVINKAENLNYFDLNELKQFNIAKDKIFLSAEHNFGFNDLYNSIKKQHDDWVKINDNQDITQTFCDDITEHKIRVAILGRPNVGKSTFLNNLLKENRLITSNIAGTTRDKIELNFTYDGSDFVLIDTAGIRKKHKKGDVLEAESIQKSLEALQYADIVVVIMDITTALEEQDLFLCNQVCEEGRVLIVCFNKWDLVNKNNEQELLEKLKSIICRSIPKTKGIVFFTCSAVNDKNLQSIFKTIKELYVRWNTKISASKLNKKVLEAKSTANNAVNDLKIHYINQIKTRPPTFIAFSGKDKKYITAHKVDSLRNWIYREFNVLGVSIRLSVREKKK